MQRPKTRAKRADWIAYSDHLEDQVERLSETGPAPADSSEELKLERERSRQLLRRLHASKAPPLQ